MEATQRKTASTLIIQQHDALKEQVIRAIKNVFRRKKIKDNIILKTESKIKVPTTFSSFLEIVGICKVDVIVLVYSNSTSTRMFDSCEFKSLDLNTLISILKLLEGDISEIEDPQKVL